MLSFSTFATGLLLICLPLELRQLHATPNQIGLSLAMFGFGMFAFEWLWGVAADRAGYRVPLVASQLLYALAIYILSRVDSVLLLAVAYFLASGMMVAVGPIARSYLGTALHARLRATGLALLSAQWLIVEALAGAVVRAIGMALIWPAATAWIAESMPRRRHAFYMGVFGEFENVGITIGPMLGGFVWSLFSLQAAFYTYAAAAALAAVVAWVAVHNRVGETAAVAG